MKKIFVNILFIFILFFTNFSITLSNQNTNTTNTNQGSQVDEDSADCNSDSNCITSSSYIFPTAKLVPGGTYKKTKDIGKRVEGSLLTIIQKIMIPFGVLAIFVMTIGAGYMILHNGDDGMLNKGKKIFKMGIFSIAIALSSYMLVELVKFIVYS